MAHLYAQSLSEDGSNEIQEFCNDGRWFRGARLPSALSGTSIAAIPFEFNGLQFRVYYQTDDLYIREQVLNNDGWSSGMHFLFIALSRARLTDLPCRRLPGRPRARPYPDWRAFRELARRRARCLLDEH